MFTAAALGVVALLAVGHWLLSSDSTPAPSSAAAVSLPAATTTAARPQKGGSTRKVNTAPRSLDPTLRFDWLRASEDTKYEGKGRNIFLAQVDIPQPVATVKKVDTPVAPAPPPGPPPPPPPPPINLKFFGFASKPGEPRRVFLSEGEDVFIAGEGEIVDRRYKIIRITPMAVEVEDVLNNNRQSIPLTQGS